MVVTQQMKNQHLLWRAGFGISTNDLQKFATQSTNDIFSSLAKASSGKPKYFDVSKDLIEAYSMNLSKEMTEKKDKKNDEDAQQERAREQRRINRDGLKELNITWLKEMSTTDAQLREKVALFWHGHFACRHVNSFYQQILIDQIRTNALGNFKDLLFAVSKSPSMLAFLNNQQNRKQRPNENFAREVMELFTLGRGNYTETDVKEAARAFTGWAYNPKGEFVFRQVFHDDGKKTILGKTGNFGGEDVLNIILENKKTAKFISRKIYKFFVNEDVDEGKVTWLADRFFQGNYNINNLVKDIFTSDWFYDAKNIGNKIKSPVELLVGMRRLLPMQMANEEVQLLFQRSLGQVLFYPPNVAGWPGGKNWIDSSSLMLRLRIPQLIKDNDAIGVIPKGDDDQLMGMVEDEKGQLVNLTKKGAIDNNKMRINANVDWQAYIKQFETIPREKLFNTLEGIVLQATPGTVNKATVEKVIDKSSRENYIKTATVAFMSTPEYQLC
jgi:uncharacterized protein (DUF1800 family)